MLVAHMPTYKNLLRNDVRLDFKAPDALRPFVAQPLSNRLSNRYAD